MESIAYNGIMRIGDRMDSISENNNISTGKPGCFFCCCILIMEFFAAVAGICCGFTSYSVVDEERINNFKEQQPKHKFTNETFKLQT